MQNISPLSFKRQKLSRIVALCLLSIIGTNLSAEQFPWWYSKLLGWHMPQWLIRFLEQPEIVAAIVTCVYLIHIALFITLVLKIITLKRQLRTMTLERDTLKYRYDQLHHQAAMSQLTIFHARPAQRDLMAAHNQYPCPTCDINKQNIPSEHQKNIHSEHGQKNL